MKMLSKPDWSGEKRRREKECSSFEARRKERKKKERREGKEEGESKTKRTGVGFSGSRVLWSSAAV